MSGSGRAGNGRGNNRKRPFKRWNKDNNSWQDDNASFRNDASRTSAGAQRLPEKGPVSGGESRSSRAAAAGSENQSRQNRGGFSRRGGENPRSERTPAFERPKWIPPKINTEPLPAPDCPWCGKPIRDISLAMTDKDTGAPVHFECVTARIAGGENLEKGEVLTYIGGGRFGIVSFGYSGESTGESHPVGHDFKIKKIIEWENMDKRAEWRSVICEHFSIT